MHSYDFDSFFFFNLHKINLPFSPLQSHGLVFCDGKEVVVNRKMGITVK